MDSIPLIFPCHLSCEQKTELLAICSELSTILHHYDSICLETPLIQGIRLMEVIGDISSAVHHCQFKQFRFTSYNLRISMIKLSFILDKSIELTSVSSAIIDKVLITSIEIINNIILNCHDLYIDSK